MAVFDTHPTTHPDVINFAEGPARVNDNSAYFIRGKLQVGDLIVLEVHVHVLELSEKRGAVGKLKLGKSIPAPLGCELSAHFKPQKLSLLFVIKHSRFCAQF